MPTDRAGRPNRRAPGCNPEVGLYRVGANPTLPTKFTTHIGYHLAEYYRPPENTVLVSIRDEANWPRPECPTYVDRLVLTFHDVCRPLIEIPESIRGNWRGAYTPPSPEHARAIAVFLRQHWDCNVVAHCEAGISRSAAVAEICRRLGWVLKHSNS